MVIISKARLIEFYDAEHRAKEPLLKWYYEVLGSDWSGFSDVKKTFNSVDAVGNDRFVFNIGGNKYRLVAMIHFSRRTLYIRFVGTHKEYDAIDCKTI
ncbi:addiction module toxin RelE [Niabella ginsenosidivorans]|uniref:Addiction module toxin RelE n=1 Tax=Niabella ginsenosidivorans TaxID=1176587 RepID=A0A1A9I022_9BACT|nr:type II toxin-antitoxin system HigB family toxin [Niabella ginsenosidivorans]ANH80071.1 addiction module toxin RelE [Niabella ginsenosidivorans]